MTTETRIHKQIAAHFVAIFKTLAYLLQTRSRIIQLGLAMTAALALVLPMPLVYLLAAGIGGFIVFMFIGLIHFRQYRGVAQGMMGVKGYQAKSRSNKKGAFETILFTLSFLTCFLSVIAFGVLALQGFSVLSLLKDFFAVITLFTVTPLFCKIMSDLGHALDKTFIGRKLNAFLHTLSESFHYLIVKACLAGKMNSLKQFFYTILVMPFIKLYHFIHALNRNVIEKVQIILKEHLLSLAYLLITFVLLSSSIYSSLMKYFSLYHLPLLMPLSLLAAISVFIIEIIFSWKTVMKILTDFKFVREKGELVNGAFSFEQIWESFLSGSLSRKCLILIGVVVSLFGAMGLVFASFLPLLNAGYTTLLLPMILSSVIVGLLNIDHICPLLMNVADQLFSQEQGVDESVSILNDQRLKPAYALTAKQELFPQCAINQRKHRQTLSVRDVRVS